jgi:hypothetical protein
MSNVIAIAQRELKSYFASPIAYVVIGMFVLLYGYFFIVMLDYFMRMSLQMGQMGGQQAANVNEMLVRPLMQNVLILFLFMLPAVTMRTFSEEKRSGTVELLLTSPLTDMQMASRSSTSRCSLSTARPSGSRSRPPTWDCSCSAGASSRSDCSSRASRRTR